MGGSHGFGNWSDIADTIGTGKTREEVEEHYQRIFLEDASFIPVLFSIFSKHKSSATEHLMVVCIPMNHKRSPK